MQKIAWILNITGWVLTIRALWLLIAGSMVGGAIVTGIVYFFSHLPIWLLIIIFIGLAIILFVGFGYLSDAIKKRKAKKKKRVTKEEIQSKVIIGGLVGRSSGGKITRSDYKGKIISRGKSKDIIVGGLIGQNEGTEIVDSSADAEIEYKQDKE